MTATATPSRLAPRRAPKSRLDAVPTPLLHVDWLLVVATVATAALGAVMVFSATRGPEGDPTTFFVQRQAMFIGVGVLLMVGAAAFDYRRLRDWAVPIGVVALAMLVAVLTPVGSTSNGTQGWFQLAGFQLQPSEFAKLALVIALAAFCTFEAARLELRRLALALAIAAVPMALILLQPDLGTVLVFGATTLGILLVAGARPRHFAVLLLVAIVGTVGLLNSGVLAQYQTDRLTSFLNPGDVTGVAYNQDQSQIAIGAGGVSGQGLFDGTQTGLDFVPEQHTDFIFTVVGEELGFVGAVGLLALLAVIIWRMWRTAQLARDDFGMLLCVGVMAMVVFQVFQNVGMAVGIMPITGIPLPLMSYGGSSILTVFLGVGLVLNVHIHRYS